MFVLQLPIVVVDIYAVTDACVWHITTRCSSINFVLVMDAVCGSILFCASYFLHIASSVLQIFLLSLPLDCSCS